MAHAWKACWCNSLTSSNLVSSAIALFLPKGKELFHFSRAPRRRMAGIGRHKPLPPARNTIRPQLRMARTLEPRQNKTVAAAKRPAPFRFSMPASGHIPQAAQAAEHILQLCAPSAKHTAARPPGKKPTTLAIPPLSDTDNTTGTPHIPQSPAGGTHNCEIQRKPPTKTTTSPDPPWMARAFPDDQRPMPQTRSQAAITPPPATTCASHSPESTATPAAPAFSFSKGCYG